MKNKWILKNGMASQEFDSFPFAFRTMFSIVKKAVESKNSANVIGQLSIVSPIMDRSTGKPKVYSYTAATQFAKDTGVLTTDGQINSREFKRF